MSKTNFTKVEEAFDDGLRKITINKYLEMADQAAQTKPVANPESNHHPSTEEMGWLKTLELDLKKLEKQGVKPYETLEIDKNTLNIFFRNQKEITRSDWETIKQLKEKVKVFKSELKKTVPETINEEIVTQERLKHITKRFNVNEKWLPL